MASSVLTRYSLKTRIVLFTLAVFLLGIWSLAFYISRMLRDDMERMLGEQQFSTVTLLAAQVDQELDDRLRALEKVAAQITPVLLDNPAAMQSHLEARPVLQMLFNGGVFVTRLDGTALADAPLSGKRVGVNYLDRDYLIDAIKEGRTNISKPILSKTLNAPVFATAAPIRDAQGKVIGAVVGSTELSKTSFLNKITDNRYGKTGGYLVNSPKDRLVITATDKRRIMLPLPAPGVNPTVDRFIAGYEGYAVFVGAMGEEHMASSRHIPVAGWDMTATLPTEEAFAPIREMQQRMFFATTLFTLLVGGLVWWMASAMLRRRFSPMIAAAKMLEDLSEEKQPPKLLPVTSEDEIGELIGSFNRLLETLGLREESMKESEARYRTLIESTS
jgi:HAMP domain-containing protein